MKSHCSTNYAKRMLKSGALILAIVAGVAQAEPVKPVDQLAQADARLAAIGYRLAEANANRCERPEMMTGLTFHDIAGYDAEVRGAVLKAHALTQGFGIQALLPNGAGARAGLRRGDEIVAINGTDLQGFGAALITRKASYRRVEAFLGLLDIALRAGPATVTIRRDGQTQDLTLAGDAGCGGQFTVQPGRAFNAWSDGHYVAVTTHMMETIADDDELAFVVAHEMAHNILRHSEILAGKSGFFAELGFGSGKVKATEIAADQLAVRLIASAGFDRAAPERFLRRSASFRVGDLAITHPGLNTRIRMVDAAFASLTPSLTPAPGAAPVSIAGTPRIERAVLQWTLAPLPPSLVTFLTRNAAHGAPGLLPIGGTVSPAPSAPVLAADWGLRAVGSPTGDPWRVGLSRLTLRPMPAVAARVAGVGAPSTARCEPVSPTRMAALDGGAERWTFGQGDAAASLGIKVPAAPVSLVTDLAAIASSGPANG